jgi:uncharacterized protein Yka (UPF0111/DUF47 family)
MNDQPKNFVSRMIDRIFPRTIDFFALLDAQCEIVVEAITAFDQFMKENRPELGERVLALEHAGDEMKRQHMDELNRTFATPIDREDIVKAIVSLDEILGYAKATVREMEILQVDPDLPMQQMAGRILEGSVSLQQGYSKLKKHPLEAEPHAENARKTERRIEKIYRSAVSKLFDEKRLLESIQSSGDEAIVTAVTGVVKMLRRRELYRHLSNAADRIEIAAETLHDIIVKIA